MLVLILMLLLILMLMLMRLVVWERVSVCEWMYSFNPANFPRRQDRSNQKKSAKKTHDWFVPLKLWKC